MAKTEYELKESEQYYAEKMVGKMLELERKYRLLEELLQDEMTGIQKREKLPLTMVLDKSAHPWRLTMPQIPKNAVENKNVRKG